LLTLPFLKIFGGNGEKQEDSQEKPEHYGFFVESR
jgi:hypothetical protein